MAKGKRKCDLSLGQMEQENNALVTGYKLDADDAIASIIGYPKKGDKVHQAFYNDLYSYFMESGQLANYDLDPWIMAEQWQNYYSSVYVDFINKDTSKISPYRMKAMHTKFKKIKKKRDKALKSWWKKDGAMSNTSRALLPPSILAMRHDRYGFISKLVQATKDISDKIKQSYATFDSDVATISKRFMNNAKALYKNADKSAVLDGLQMQDNSGRILTVHNRGQNEGGNPILLVSYPENPLEEVDGVVRPRQKWIAMSQLGITEDAYEDAYIKKYRDDFINDLLHGQTRYVRWHTQDSAKGDDQLIVESEQELLSHRNATDGVSNKSRKFKTSRIVVPDPNNPNLTLWAGEIAFIMIKDSEGQGKETYNTYLTGVKSDEDAGWMNQKNSKEQDFDSYQMVKDFLKDGYYNSQKIETFTNHQKRPSIEQLRKMRRGSELHRETYKKYLDAQNEAGELYPDNSESNAYVDFQYMENQPDSMMADETAIGSSVEAPYSNMWELLSQYRKTYKQVGRDIKKFAKRTEGKRGRLEKLIKIELKKKGLDDEAIENWMQEKIYDVAGLDSRVWSDKYGDIHTPDTSLELRQENYAPIKWTKKNFFEMLDNAIAEIQTTLKLSAADMDKATLKDKKAYLQELLDMQHATADRQPTEKMVDQAVSIHKKRRKLWTNPLTRRKNQQVHMDYLDDTYRNLHKNELTTELIEQMYNSIKTDRQIPEDSIDYMVNRVKLAFGRADIDTKVMTPLGWANWDNSRIASMLNNLPNFIRRGRKWNAESVEGMWLTMNGLLTMRFLGPGGAVGNRTQSLNNIVAWGWKSFMKTKDEINSRQDFWDGVVNETGVLNLLSVFNDVMLQGGKLDWNDFGFVPGGDVATEMAFGAAVPIPGKKFFDWRKIVRAGKPAFIKNGNKSIDRTLLNIMNTSLTEDDLADVQYARELDDAVNEFNETGGYDVDNLSPELAAELRKRRGAYWELQMTDKENNRPEILERRFKALLGDISDTQLRKMVTWKLSYWWEGLGEKMFTFTKGEQKMRYETAVQALLVADSKGLLGDAKDQKERMTSPMAIKVARDAVYQMMFGMAPVHLGEAFSGVGRTLAQYKSYPLFQHIKDYNTMSNFWDGGNRTGRLMREFFRIMRKGGYDVNGEHDHEAAAAARLVLTRGVATGLTATAGMIPLVNPFLRRISMDGGIGVLGAMRAAENPLAGTTFRLITWSVLMGMGWGDNEEQDEKEKDLINRLLFLTVPAILGSIARWGYDAIETYDNDEGIWDIF